MALELGNDYSLEESLYTLQKNLDLLEEMVGRDVDMRGDVNQVTETNNMTGHQSKGDCFIIS